MTVSEWYLKMKDGVSSTLSKIGVGADSASSKFTTLQKGASETAAKLDTASRAGGGLTDTLKGLAAVAGLTLGVAGIRSIGDALIETANKAEGFQRALKLIEGDSRQSATTFQYLKDTADKYGASFETISEGYKKIASSTRGTQLAGQATKDLLEGITMASTSLGLGADESMGALLAMSQMISKGKVSMEELSGQLGERLPGALQIAARAMHITTDELIKKVSSGELSGNQFIPKFAQQLKLEFEQSANEASNSLQAIQNRMSNTFLYFRQELATSLVPYFSRAFQKITQIFKSHQAEIMDSIKGLIGVFLKLGSVVFKVGKFMYEYSNTILSLISLYAIWKTQLIITNGLIALNAWYVRGSTAAFVLHALSVGSATTAWQVLSAAMRANPFTTAIIAIGAVTLALVPFIDRLANVNKELDAMMAKQIELEKNTVQEIFNTEIENVNKLMEGYKKLGVEKARTAAIAAEIESLRKAANQIALLPQVNGHMSAENQKKYDNIMTALGALRSKGFMEALKGSNERLFGRPAGTDPSATNKKIEDGINSVSGGGKQVRNVNVNIGKLIEQFNIKSSSVTEGAQEMKQIIEEYLLRAVNGAELALGNE